MGSNINIGSFDPCIKLHGNYFHQTDMSTWLPTTAGNLTALLKSDNPPEFRTVLGICANISVDKIEGPYSGPLYFDFDSEDLEEAILRFQEFLHKLQSMGVTLDSIRLFVSGSRGFHVEVPQQIFMAEVPAGGVPYLPLIYKEIAFSLYVETLDIRVYSQGRGRCWRVPNRQRSNGKYKAPLTVEQALSLTKSEYEELISEPRPYPQLAAPEFNAELGLLYVNARDKVLEKQKRVRPISGENKTFMARFKGKLPASLAALGQGRFPARRGWNEIVMQWCLAAIAVGMDEDATVAACKGLIHSHESDGNRYNSPRKREDALRSMYRYLERNSAYSVSVAGIRSILPQGLRCNDFRGLGHGH